LSLTDLLSELFEHFETNNFEYILRIVNNAHDVNSALKIDEGKTEEAYREIRDALIGIVQKVHVALFNRAIASK